MGPLLDTKTPNVGVAFALIWVVTVGVGKETQRPVSGMVWQMRRLTGRPAAPVSAETVIRPVAPTLTVATAKAPALARLTMPVLPAVAASATMSGTGVTDAESRSVLRPVVIGAGAVLVQPKARWTSVGAKGPVGVKANTKL